MKKLLFIIIFSLITGCAQITLEPSDFAWPIESVLDIDDDGMIQENRYSFSTNVKSLFIEETQDSSAFLKSSVRIIRDTKGYYYLIANGFKNVYLFNAVDGKLVLINSYLISEFGLDLPAFNQRKPYVELLEGEEHIAFLSSEGIKGEE